MSNSWIVASPRRAVEARPIEDVDPEKESLTSMC